MNKELSIEEIIAKHTHSNILPVSKEIHAAIQDFADQEKRELEKENKELQEKIIELETVIAKISYKILNNTSY